jgi:hypothetical protein
LLEFLSMKAFQRLIQRWLQRKFWLLAVAVLGGLLLVAPAWSQTNGPRTIAAGEVLNEDVFLEGDTVVIDGTVNGNAFLAGEAITINGTVSDDVYLAGETITINGTVGGDAIAAGSRIILNGRVDEDLTIAGRTLIVDGIVGDDVRMAGQILQLGSAADVGDDVIAAGGSLATAAASVVEGNLNLAMGLADLAGTVDQNLTGGMGSAQLSGNIGGNATLFVGAMKPTIFAPMADLEPADIPVGLTLTEASRINGTLTYRSSQEADISDGARIGGEVTYRAVDPVADTAAFSGAWIWGLLQRFLALLIVGALLLWWRPGWLHSLAAKEQEKPWPSLGWGALAVVIVIVLAVAIALVTLVLTALFAFILQGLALPVLGIGTVANLALTVGFGIFAAFIPQIVISLWGGEWLLKRFGRQSSQRYLALVLGLVLFVLVTAIPILGGLINLMVILLGLGALWLWFRARDNATTTALSTEG